jgi:hypothetical protein
MVAVRMADGSTYEVNTLLSKGDSNTKLRKSNNSGKGYKTVGLSLSPANESGYQTCSSSSAGCRKACLFTAGYGVYEPVRKARIAKTRLFFQDRDIFKKMLISELTTWQRRVNRKGYKLACRLNVVSDIAWEKMMPELFALFPDVQFYDYTKHAIRAMNWDSGKLPANYYLTFSRSEDNDNEIDVILNESNRLNITVVFDSHELPEYWQGRKVINGDETDLRFLDEPGTIVGLYAKGRARKDESGFVVSTNRVSLEVI